MFNVTSAELHFEFSIFVDIGDVRDIGDLVNTAGLIGLFS